jgi:hypothetical protein
MRDVVLAVLGLVVLAGPSVAQSREPLKGVSVDLFGATTGLPSAEGWTPTVPAGGTVPSRGLGLQGGADAVLGRVARMRFSVGGALLIARGTTTPVASAGTTTTAPEVSTRFTSLAPHLSVNFGHNRGWSYLSAGYGVVKVASERLATASTPAFSIVGGWSRAIEFAFGARWMIKEHLGAGFDARWHKLMTRDPAAAVPGAPRTTVFTLAAGITLK